MLSNRSEFEKHFPSESKYKYLINSNIREEGVMEYIFDKEYFHNYSKEVRYLYVAHSFCGGMYYETYMNIWFRYFCSGISLCSAILIIFDSIIILPQLETNDFSSLCTIAVYFSTLCWEFIIVSWNYRYRKDFYKFLELVNAHGDEIDHHDDDGDKNSCYRKTNFIALFQKLPIVMLLCMMSILLIKLLRTYIHNDFTNTSFTIHYIQDYMYAMPMFKSPSPITYVVICILQTITVLAHFLPLYSVHSILYAITICVKNQATSLRRRIKMRSEFTFEKLEQSFENESKILRSEICWNLKHQQLLAEQKIREKYMDEYFIDLCQWIRNQQELTAFMNLAKGYFEIILRINIAFISFGVILLGYYAQKVASDFSAMSYQEYLLALPQHGVILFFYCWIGNTFAQLNTELAEELNNSPWYYLPPNKRRVFLTFLCLTQKQMTLCVFGRYPINLSLFPELLKKAFDFIQLIWFIRVETTNLK